VRWMDVRRNEWTRRFHRDAFRCGWRRSYSALSPIILLEVEGGYKAQYYCVLLGFRLVEQRHHCGIRSLRIVRVQPDDVPLVGLGALLLQFAVRFLDLAHRSVVAWPHVSFPKPSNVTAPGPHDPPPGWSAAGGAALGRVPSPRVPVQPGCFRLSDRAAEGR
jgi:hypothetical protein